MKNKAIFKKILFLIQTIALINLLMSIFIMVWALYIVPKNNVNIIMFNIAGESLIFLFGMIFSILEFVYLLLYGVYKKKVLISVFSVFILILTCVNILLMSLTLSRVENKVFISEIDETLYITNQTSLHDNIQVLYEKKFFVFYKEIYYEVNSNLSEKRSFNQDNKIYQYYNKEFTIKYFNYDLDKDIIVIFDYIDEELIFKNRIFE